MTRLHLISLSDAVAIAAFVALPLILWGWELVS